MSQLRHEISACMQDLESGEGTTYTAQFIFPGNFTGFKGHFPGRPVLPGVCMIQAVLSMCQAFNADPVHLQEVINAKFANPASCDEVLTIACREVTETDGHSRVKATIRRQTERLAQIDLRIRREPRRQTE